MSLPEALLQKLDGLPVRPGCYVFRGRAPEGKPNEAAEVLYVGKAKSLRARVRSYFQDGGSDNRYFIPLLRRVVGDVDTIVTATEKEAAILENNLIKQYQPRYNVKLRDNKEFLSLRIDAKHEWPRLDVVRKPVDDGAFYFGPYHSATAARRTLYLVNKHFQLRTCSDQELTSRARPCLQHQIKRCPAPCVYEVDRGWYGEQVRSVELFLSGRHDELSRELTGRMKEASGSLEFELAAIYRDQLRAVEAIRMQQRVVQTGAALHVAQDVVGLHREGDLAELVVLYVRNGRLSDTANFSFEGAELETSELVAAFVAQHYAPLAEGGALPPDEIILPCALEAEHGVEELLTERRTAARVVDGSTGKTSVVLLVPQRGPRAHLIKMANDNAKHAFEQKRRASDNVGERLEQLRQRLRLSVLPRRIECCDISHLGGGDTVGAIVAMLDGAPDSKRYKSFHVKGVRDGDDYGAMYEVLARRFRRARKSQGPTADETPEEASADVDWELPDLFVVDGGKGQLSVALAAAHDLGLHQLPIVALAKEKDYGSEHVVDRVYLPNQKNAIPLREHTASMFFLARVRDEAHRFANKIRARLGQKRRLRSRVDELRGVGVELRKELLRKLGSMRAIEAADDATLLSVPGFTRRHLTALRRVIPTPQRDSEDGASGGT